MVTRPAVDPFHRPSQWARRTVHMPRIRPDATACSHIDNCTECDRPASLSPLDRQSIGSRPTGTGSVLGRNRGLSSAKYACYPPPIEANFQSINEFRKRVTRRYFFRDCALGVGSLALASLLRDNDVFAAGIRSGANPLAP